MLHYLIHVSLLGPLNPRSWLCSSSASRGISWKPEGDKDSRPDRAGSEADSLAGMAGRAHAHTPLGSRGGAGWGGAGASSRFDEVKAQPAMNDANAADGPRLHMHGGARRARRGAAVLTRRPSPPYHSALRRDAPHHLAHRVMTMIASLRSLQEQQRHASS